VVEELLEVVLLVHDAERVVRALGDEVGSRGEPAAVDDGKLDPEADPTQVGAVLLGILHGFALQRLLIPDTTPDKYLAGVRALLSG
jgi:hypothetical protein